MRTIKFRAWDKRIEKMICPVGVTKVGEATINGADLGDDAILMQFTGLKDLKGKEIYEGDIIEYTNHYRHLTWKAWDNGKRMENLDSNPEQRKGLVRFEKGGFHLGYKLSFRDIGGSIKIGEPDVWLRDCLEGRKITGETVNGDSQEWYKNFVVVGNIYENPDIEYLNY